MAARSDLYENTMKLRRSIFRRKFHADRAVLKTLSPLVFHQQAKLYRGVIEDVISGVRDSFLDEGVDEAVLQELKQIWENKLAASKSIEPLADLAETQLQTKVQQSTKNFCSFVKRFNLPKFPLSAVLFPQASNEKLQRRSKRQQRPQQQQLVNVWISNTFVQHVLATKTGYFY